MAAISGSKRVVHERKEAPVNAIQGKDSVSPLARKAISQVSSSQQASKTSSKEYVDKTFDDTEDLPSPVSQFSSSSTNSYFPDGFPEQLKPLYSLLDKLAKAPSLTWKDFQDLREASDDAERNPRMDSNLLYVRMAVSKQLRTLDLTGIESHELFTLFERLEHFNLADKIEVIEITRSGISQIPDLSAFKELHTLKIHHCLGLLMLPDLTRNTKLRTLIITSCGLLTELPTLINNKLLEKLTISCCSKLASPPDLKGQDRLASLEISVCPKLKHLPSLDDCENLRFLTLQDGKMIKHLDFRKCKKLQNLEIRCFESLETVDVSQCTELNDIWIFDCQALTNLSGLNHLTQLRSFRIELSPSFKDLGLLKECKQLVELSAESSMIKNTEALAKEFEDALPNCDVYI